MQKVENNYMRNFSSIIENIANDIGRFPKFINFLTSERVNLN
jgi:hypothetical protein